MKDVIGAIINVPITAAILWHFGPIAARGFGFEFDPTFLQAVAIVFVAGCFRSYSVSLYLREIRDSLRS